jgi:enoyl-CoA hydratase/carnithine racemase
VPGKVITELDGHIGMVELDGPEPNYLHGALVEELVDAVGTLDRNTQCRVIVLCASGRHFCAGANFGEGGIGPDRPSAARRLYGAAARLFDAGVPVIAAVQGAAVGAGLGLACSADFRVASRLSRFHANFTLLGFHPGFALSVTLPAIVGPQRAMDLLFSGRRIGGAEAAAMGLVDRLADDGAERAVAFEWAAEIAAAAPLAVRAVKKTLRTELAAAARVAMEHELAAQTWLWETEDSRIGIEAAAQRRQPHFEGR